MANVEFRFGGSWFRGVSAGKFPLVAAKLANSVKLR
jgi:hypothetical protein